MAHAIWKGAVSFGLVNIPVSLYSGVRDQGPHFRLLHAKDTSPVRQQRVCLEDEQPVEWDDIMKGYEYAKGKFVVMTEEDFTAAALEKSHTIDILKFVQADEIDDRYFETPYYVAPVQGGERAYALLREAIRKSGKIGVAKIIIRERQHLAAIAAIERMLVLTMMRFADELVDASEFAVPGNEKIRSQELEMATSLVNTLASPWNPHEYTDEYRANLMRIINAKIKRKQPKLKSQPKDSQRAGVVDLMERLRQSLEARQEADQVKPRRKKSKTSSKVARRVA